MIPMPPWICTALWPEKRAPRAIFDLAALTAALRASAGSSSFSVAISVMETACSVSMNMSTMRCCSTWNSLIARPNCLRWRA